MRTNHFLSGGLQASMGAAVLEKLGAMAELPANGYVAGQSVASALSELFGDGRAVVYNDVDVFRDIEEGSDGPEEDYDRDTAGTERKAPALRLTQFTGNDLVREYGQVSLAAAKRYQVRKVSRDGLLNEILCEFESKAPLDLLATFDMNCVQVGVDIETKALFWTPAFSEFCRTRQLDIVSLHTPFHSLIRYFRKRQELEGIYGNDERMIEMVGVSYHRGAEMRDDGVLREYADLRWRFGHVMDQKLIGVADRVSPHFDVVEEVFDGYCVKHLKPRFDAPWDLLDQARDLPLTTCLPLVSRAMREKHRPAKTERLIHLLNQPVSESACRRTWAKHEEGFVRGNVTSNQMRQLDHLCKEHAVEHIVMCDTLAESWDRYKALQQEAAARGLWVYGALENTKREAIEASSLSEVLDETEALLNETLVPPSFPPVVIAGFDVQELTTGRELIEEGVAMHHCVGGYASAVKSGDTRIFSLLPQGGRKVGAATLQLKKGSLGVWRVVQCRGLQNRGATDAQFAAARRVRNFVMAGRIVPRPLRKWAIDYMPGTANAVGEAMHSVLGRLSRSLPKFQKPANINEWVADKLGLDRYIYWRTGTRTRAYWVEEKPLGYWTAVAVTALQRFSRRVHLTSLSSKLENWFGQQEPPDLFEIPF